MCIGHRYIIYDMCMYHKFKFLCVHSLNLTKNNLTKKLGTYIIYDMCIYHKFLCVLFNKNELNQKNEFLCVLFVCGH